MLALRALAGFFLHRARQSGRAVSLIASMTLGILLGAGVAIDYEVTVKSLTVPRFWLALIGVWFIFSLTLFILDYKRRDFETADGGF